MNYYIHPFTLRLARTWIYDDGERSCCRTAVKFGWLHTTTKGTSCPMSPGEANRQHADMQHALYKGGYWPLWFFLLCCMAYVAMMTEFVYYIITR